MIGSRQEMLDDEWLIVRHSGEIPEIALSSVIYYLTEDDQGPHIRLSRKEKNYLYSGAKQRYKEIVLRDLLPENRDKTIYRGIQRSICNYHRLNQYCQRFGIDASAFRPQVASTLLSFLCQEVDDVISGRRSCCLNATYNEIIAFCVELGMDLDRLPPRLKEILSPVVPTVSS